MLDTVSLVGSWSHVGWLGVTLLHCTTLLCVALHYTILYYTAPRYSVVQCTTVSNQSLQQVSAMPQSTLDKSSHQYNLFGYHTWNCGIRTLDPRSGRQELIVKAREIRSKKRTTKLCTCLTISGSASSWVELRKASRDQKPFTYKTGFVRFNCKKILFTCLKKNILTLSKNPWLKKSSCSGWRVPWHWLW